MFLASKIGTQPGEFKEIVHFFVKENNADINATNQEGFTPLHVALKKKQGGQNLPEVVFSLLEFNADSSLPPKSQNSGLNTLHLAIKTANRQVVLLITNNLQIDHKDKFQAMCFQNFEDTANCYEFAQLHKNLEIIMAFKEMISHFSPGVLHKDKEEIFFTILFPEGGKKKGRDEKSATNIVRVFISDLCTKGVGHCACDMQG